MSSDTSIADRCCNVVSVACRSFSLVVRTRAHLEIFAPEPVQIGLRPTAACVDRS